MRGIKEDIGSEDFEPEHLVSNAVVNRPVFQVYGHDYKPMSYFLYGLVPAIGSLIGRELLPSYDFFRIYREGDLCRVHADRPSCEHSVSLTLDYSDGEVWDLQVACSRTSSGQSVTEDFGDREYSTIGMNVGDAVIYQGVHHCHGRITPNPNAWSAHLFLHFVERGGPFEEYAFDRRVNLAPVNFSFA